MTLASHKDDIEKEATKKFLARLQAIPACLHIEQDQNDIRHFTVDGKDGSRRDMFTAALDTTTHLARHLVLEAMTRAREQGVTTFSSRYKYKGRDEYKHARSKAYLASAFSGLDPSFHGIFAQDGELAGWFMFRKQHAMPYLKCFAIILEEAWRGKGIARGLGEHLRKRWREHVPDPAIIGLFACTRETNLPARGALDAIGLHPVSRSKLSTDTRIVYLNYVAWDVETIVNRMKQEMTATNVHEFIEEDRDEQPRLEDLPSKLASLDDGDIEALTNNGLKNKKHP